MHIARFEVEEGFLRGLSLSFTPGLNVIIGPRGVGKSSVIELIRYCLGVRGYTVTSDEDARNHAIEVLEGGRVTVTLMVDGQPLKVSRSAADPEPILSTRLLYDNPIILSQNEIEEVAKDQVGRVRILDGFRSSEPKSSREESAALSLVRSLTVELQADAETIRQIAADIEELSSVPVELGAAKKDQASLLTSLRGLTDEQAELTSLSTLSAEQGVAMESLRQASEALASFETRLINFVTTGVRLNSWPTAAGEPDLLATTRKTVSEAMADLNSALDRIRTAQRELAAPLERLAGASVATANRARELRQVVEAAQKGAGLVARKIEDLEKQNARLNALKQSHKERLEVLAKTQRERASLLDELDSLRGRRFSDRRMVADQLNSALGPQIEVSVQPSALTEDYSSVIAAGLQGSGVHRKIAVDLANALNPRELVEAIESHNETLLSETTGIPVERARRILESLASYGCEKILAAPVEDGVTLRLLDGDQPKDSDHLSTGQRCTVVLPILLEHRERTLIVDQPEDHLDNAFITGTLIQALLKRSPTGQIIFSSHNANIPVLGEANSVIHLGSDGERGYKEGSGNLDDVATVKAISSIMEGGREAFLLRAAFYQERLG